jgi:hypothetical protein
MKQFTTIEKLDTGILYSLELASSVSVLLLAFGLIASMANVLTKGAILTEDPIMQRIWAVTQCVGIDAGMSGTIIRAFRFHAEGQKVKTWLYGLLSVLLLFTAAIVLNIESVQQTLNITLEKAYIHAFIPVEVLIWIGSIAIVLLIVAPAVNELAREVGFRYFDKPLFEQTRNTVYEEMRAHLTYLAEHPTAADRDERMSILVACPQPLQDLLTSRFPESDDEMRQLMLEVLIRRYYRTRWLEEFECTMVDGQTVAKAAYDYEGARIVAVTTFARYEDLDAAATAMARFVRRFPEEHDVVVDFYLWRSDLLGKAETTEQEIRRILNQTNFARHLRRIVVAVSAPGKGLGIASTQHFTYRPGENGYQEERLFRGLHPMIGERLHLWRLANFEIERLPSVEDVYLFRGIARENPQDKRLFALAEVRDVTPLRNETGSIVQIPHLARMLMETLDAIRLYQSRLPAHKRLSWNSCASSGLPLKGSAWRGSWCMPGS